MPYYSPYFIYISIPILLTGLFFQIEHKLTKPWMRWAWWLACLALLLLIGWYASQEQYLYDFFKGYYHGGRKIVRDLEALYDENCYNFTNFPLVAFLFAPLANLEKEYAGTIFFLAGYVTILPLAYWLVKLAELKGGLRWLVLALLALNGPLDYNIWLGNITQVITLGLLLVLWWVKTGKEWLAGILLGVNGLLKIPLILPAGYFFVQRRWRVVGGGLLIFTLVLAASLIFVPFWLNSLWADRCILSMAGNPITAYNNQSLSGFLSRQLIPGYVGWFPIAPNPQYQLASAFAQLVLYAPIVFILFIGFKHPATPKTQTSEFLILVTGSLLTSPIAWTHYLLMLIIPIALYIKENSEEQNKLWLNILFWAGVLLLSIPINSTQALFEQTGQILFLSLHFLGMLLLYITLVIRWSQKYLTAKQTSA
ncbi:MAG: DUF2029 domain-containing protein [Anaerolineales bacterium]|nr:DUF2029 domain-containing protein [Anaerolineales bacterium]